MKLVIGGSSGFVGTELVRQALSHSSIDSVVGLSRRETSVPEGSFDAVGKFQSVVCGDFEDYPDVVKGAIAGADACIWTIAVTPSKSREVSWDAQCKVSRDYAVAAVKQLSSAHDRMKQPLRFVYMSGHFAKRGEDDTPQVVKEPHVIKTLLMRGETESLLLDISEKSEGSIDVAIARPGFITGSGRVPPPVPNLPTIGSSEVCAALIEQVLYGFDKDTLSNDDLKRIGRGALK